MGAENGYNVKATLSVFPRRARRRKDREERITGSNL
jgi:hypothetical protein